MKRYILTAYLLLLFTSSFAQVDYCTEIKKAIKAAADNFSTYKEYQFQTVGGQKAYLADFSFVSGEKGYIYFYPTTQKIDFFQKISSDKLKYQDIYKSIEGCLVKDDNYWTKLDGAQNTSVIFACDKTGCEVSLVASDAGVTVIIERNKSKNIPVFTNAFCTTLKYITADAITDFKNTTGAYIDSSILGKSYKCTQQLNQRGLVPHITVHPSYIKANTMEYNYTEMVSGSEMDPATVLGYFDQCLTTTDGWQKGKPDYGEGVQYTKGDIAVRVTTSKSYSAKEADNTHISIQKKSKY